MQDLVECNSCFSAVIYSQCQTAVESVLAMLCAARRNNACKLAALILGLLSLAHILTASELLGCDESFYRNTPPQRVTESGLERRCHSLGAGRTFVSLYHPGHQSDVYTALRLGQHNAWGKGTTEELVSRSVFLVLVIATTTKHLIRRAKAVTLNRNCELHCLCFGLSHIWLYDSSTILLDLNMLCSFKHPSLLRAV